MVEIINGVPYNPDMLKVNGEYHSENPDGLFMTAVYTFIDDKKKKVQSFFDEFSPTAVLDTAEKHPGLVAAYLPELYKANFIQLKDLILLINSKPEYARGLEKVFKQYPELVRIYANLTISANDEQISADVRLRRNRLSASQDDEKILARIEENKVLYSELITKADASEQTEEIKDYPYVVASTFHGRAKVTLTKIDNPEPGKEPDLQILVSTSNPEVAYFSSIVINVSARGIIDGDSAHNQFQDTGYCFKEENSEVEIIEALKNFEFGSKELQNALEASESLKKLTGRDQLPDGEFSLDTFIPFYMSLHRDIFAKWTEIDETVDFPTLIELYSLDDPLTEARGISIENLIKWAYKNNYLKMKQYNELSKHLRI